MGLKHLKYFSFTVIVVVACILYIGCIERTNPWDPINIAACAEKKINDVIAAADSLVEVSKAASEVADSYLSQFIADSLEFYHLVDSNIRIDKNNRQIFNNNILIEAHNKSIINPDSLSFKTGLDTLFVALNLFGLNSEKAYRQKLTLERMQLTFDSKTAKFRSECIVYRDSLNELEKKVQISFSNAYEKLVSYLSSIEIFTRVVTDSNRIIGIRNQQLKTINSVEIGYNDSLACVVLTSKAKVLEAKADSVEEILYRYRAFFVSDSLKNCAIKDSNRQIILRNAAIEAENNKIDSINRITSISDSIKRKQKLQYISGYIPLRSFASEATILSSLMESLSDTVYKIYSEAIASKTSLLSHPNPCVETLKSKFQNAAEKLTSYTFLIAHTNAAIADSNKFSIALENQRIEQKNLLIVSYNDSIAWLKSVQQRRIITNSDSLRNKIAQAHSGDTLFLADTIFTLNGGLQFSNSGTRERPIVITGSVLGNTQLYRSQGIILSNKEYINFNHITFRNSNGSGIKLENNSGTIVFDRCNFIDNKGYGLEVIDSDIELRNCKVLRNNLSGIRFATDGTVYRQLNLHNVLIANNNAHGIEALTAGGIIIGSTISDNGGNGILLLVHTRKLALINSMITFNGGYGIEQAPKMTFSDLLSLENSNIYNNFRGEITPSNEFAYLSVDPNYVNRLNGNYSIASYGDIYELEKKGIVIGWRAK